jgi:CO/xanthine dehydrogenase Mo-binding subunit
LTAEKKVRVFNGRSPKRALAAAVVTGRFWRWHRSRPTRRERQTGELHHGKHVQKFAAGKQDRDKEIGHEA